MKNKDRELDDKFQRLPESWLLRLFYTPAISAIRMVLLGAVGLYVLNSLPSAFYRVILGIADHLFWRSQVAVFIGYLTMAFAIWGSIKMGDIYLTDSQYSSFPWRVLYGVVSIPVSTGIAIFLFAMPLYQFVVGMVWLNSFFMWLLGCILGLVLYISLLLHRATAQQRKNALGMQLETERLGTALDRAELSMLEAQIEPHFLFNTLAHVKRQYRVDNNTAGQMLAALIEYLDRALPALRKEDWSIGDELGLIQVYLEILAQRFGERLQFSIVAPDAIKTVGIPALSIATLVENSVRHGLAPKQEGGTVSILVEVTDDVMQIEVRDDGVGLRLPSGSGLGLATVRARLRSAFGVDAVLVVEPDQPCGVQASIRIPLVKPDAE